jgi:hypothetical protein
MALRRLDPSLAADAMAAHRVALAHSCWLVRTPDGGLKGCAIGALFYAQYGDVPLSVDALIDWATEITESRPYVQGFDVGFHGFTPLEQPAHEYTLGLDDGRTARLLVGAPSACRPAVWCWRKEENP